MKITGQNINKRAAGFILDSLLPTRSSASRTGGLVLLVELALVVALAFLLAKVFWLITLGATPPNTQPIVPSTLPATQAAQVDIDVVGSYDPFFRNTTITTVAERSPDLAVEEGANAPETTLNLKLYGTRFTASSDRNSSPSAAIIQDPNGKQLAVAVGDEILEGVTLYSVAPFYVTLRRDGKLERLSLDDNPALFKRADATGGDATTGRKVQTNRRPQFVIASKEKQLTAAEKQYEGRAQSLASLRKTNDAITPQDFETLLNSVTMAPRLNGRTIEGWEMSPNGALPLFEKLGLKSGDVLKRVNGKAMKNAERLTELIDDLNGVTKVALLVERSGKDVTITFDYDG